MLPYCKMLSSLVQCPEMDFIIKGSIFYVQILRAMKVFMFNLIEVFILERFMIILRLEFEDQNKVELF